MKENTLNKETSKELWPGDGLHKPGEVIKEDDRGNKNITEETIIPEVR